MGRRGGRGGVGRGARRGQKERKKKQHMLKGERIGPGSNVVVLAGHRRRHVLCPLVDGGGRPRRARPRHRVVERRRLSRPVPPALHPARLGGVRDLGAHLRGRRRVRRDRARHAPRPARRRVGVAGRVAARVRGVDARLLGAPVRGRRRVPARRLRRLRRRAAARRPLPARVVAALGEGARARPAVRLARARLGAGRGHRVGGGGRGARRGGFSAWWFVPTSAVAVAVSLAQRTPFPSAAIAWGAALSPRSAASTSLLAASSVATAAAAVLAASE